MYHSTRCDIPEDMLSLDSLLRRVRKITKTTINFVTSVCSSVRLSLMEQLDFHWDDLAQV